jgi:cobalt-zinc-cadmium efflux system outer membrane protein
MAARVRRTGPIAMAMAMAMVATLALAASGQGVGFPTVGPAGSDPLDAPRGTALPLEEHVESQGDPDAQFQGVGGFGGTTGGRGRQEGVLGAPSMPRLGPTPGDPGETRLGPPLGASGTSAFALVPGNFLDPTPLPGNRPGPAAIAGGRRGLTLEGSEARSHVTRYGTAPASVDEVQGEQEQRLAEARERLSPPAVDPFTLAPRPRLEIPAGTDDEGPPDGWTLDRAAAHLLSRNLHLRALGEEIPKARADVLTAGLLRNPNVGFATQYIPYGHYDMLHPGGGGGQPEYQLNVNQPLDVNRKRRARLAVAARALEVTEAQYQDVARKLLDNLYTAYVNVLAARDNLRFGEAFAAGIAAILRDAEADHAARRRAADAAEAESDRAGDDPGASPARRAEARAAARRAREEADDADDAVVSLRAELRQGEYGVREASQTLDGALRMLAQVLNLPPDEVPALRVRGRLRELSPLPAPAEALERQAVTARPDLVAFRLGVRRALAEVDLARKNRLPDVNLYYQPYTLQGGRAFGVRGTYSYAVGANVTIPLFNRNQGNVRRAETTVRQTQLDEQALERQVVHEVREAIAEYGRAAAGVLDLEGQVLPAVREARDADYRGYREDPSKVGEYLQGQADYNDAVRSYRNALIELRESMLRLNTAVGARVMP